MKKWLLSTVQCALCTNKNFSISAAKAAKINFYKPFCNIIVERERTSQKILTKIGTTGCTQAFLLPYNGLMIGFPGEQHYEATPLVDSVSAADTTGNATQEQHNSDPRAATSCSPILSRCFSFAEWIYTRQEAAHLSTNIWSDNITSNHVDFVYFTLDAFPYLWFRVFFKRRFSVSWAWICQSCRNS